jgi:DNA polymerase-3 subunit delta'
MNRNDDIFHKDILEKLLDQLRQNHLPHAMLIAGKDGCGHLELGIQLANTIATHYLQDQPEKLKSAQSKAEKFVHPDIHFSFPFIGPTTSNDFLPQWRNALSDNVHMNITEWMMNLDAENKQANINAKECHSIIQKLGLKSFESNYKVLVMWLPEYLGKEGNRLLKLIEEPPENTVFIFITEQLERILNTIISRCQLITIPNPSDEEIVQRLVKELNTSENEAREISFLVEGNYRLAKNMSHDRLIDYSEKLFGWLRNCYKLNPEEVVNWCDSFAKLKKEQQKYFITYALQFFRSFLLLDVIPDDKLRFRAKEIQVAKNLKRFIDLDVMESIQELLDDSFMMIERNANVKMLFMKNSIRINELLHKVPVV